MTQQLSFTNEQSYIIAAVSLDPTSVRGTGGAGYPRLIFRLDWNLSALKDSQTDYWLLGATSELFRDNHHEKLADSITKSFHHVLKGFQKSEVIELEFPLDQYRVELLEQTRNGGNIRLRLNVQILLARFGTPPKYIGEAERGITPSVTDFQQRSQSTTLEIPQSVWINNILPGLGYGLIQILEFPAVSLSACSELQGSYLALQRAQLKFTGGEYDEAIWQCRTAVDPLRQELKKIKDGNPDSLSADWAAKIGPATVDWLMTFFGKTHGVANTPVHSPNTGHFSRLDAQMVLTVTTAVVAYVARSRSPVL